MNKPAVALYIYSARARVGEVRRTGYIALLTFTRRYKIQFHFYIPVSRHRGKPVSKHRDDNTNNAQPGRMKRPPQGGLP